MKFLNVGFYIVEPVQQPKYLNINANRFITISDGSCNIHPCLAATYWLNHEEDRKRYIEKFEFSPDVFEALMNELEKFAHYIEGKGEPVLWLPY